MTLHPRAQAQVGSGLGLKRPERRRRRSRLSFCRWIIEESCPLGMRRAISQPPSKPVHPRNREFLYRWSRSFVRHEQYGGWGRSVQGRCRHPALRATAPGLRASRLGARRRANHGSQTRLLAPRRGRGDSGLEAALPAIQRHQAFLLCRRITRCFSRAQSRSFAASRLSWDCLPLASAISSFTLLPFQ